MDSDKKDNPLHYDFIDMETVEFLMKKNHIGVREMAEKVGVTPATIKRWLNGGSQKHFTADLVPKIAYALDTTISTILSWECKKPLEK